MNSEIANSYLDLISQYEMKQTNHLNLKKGERYSVGDFYHPDYLKIKELLPFTVEVLNSVLNTSNLILLDSRAEKLDYLLDNQEYEFVQHTITYPSFILTSSTIQFGCLGDSIFFNRVLPALDPTCWGMLRVLAQYYIQQEVQRSGNFYFKYPLFSECYLDRHYHLTLHLTLNYYRPHSNHFDA